MTRNPVKVVLSMGACLFAFAPPPSRGNDASSGHLDPVSGSNSART